MQTLVLECQEKLVVADRPEPVAGPGEALVRVHRVGICGTDYHAYAGRQPFFCYPRVLGHELGVEVIDPGEGATGLRAGDRCAVEPYLNCGRCRACRTGRSNCCEKLQVLGVHVDGGMRPILAVRAGKLHPSKRLGYDELALVETLAIGAHAVRRGRIERGESVAVVGAGPIGLAVAQFAAAAGARVCVLDVSAERLEFCRRRLGISFAINPAVEDPLVRLREFGDGELPSVVFEATGSPKSMERSFEFPGHAGRLILVGLIQGTVAFDDPKFHRRELDLLGSRNALPGDFAEIIAALEEGRIDIGSWIGRHFPLAETPSALPEAAKDKSLIKAVITL